MCFTDFCTFTPDDFLQYKVLAFGMRKAPATFQHLVNVVLVNVSNCSAYLDDLVMHASTWMEDMQNLRTVFQRLEKVSLTVNLAMCRFGKATVAYLGKQVSQGKVCPVEAKVMAIT